MSDQKTPMDFLGREIRVGDVCTYPVRRGSNMWLNRVVIQRISHDPRGEPKLSGLKQDGYPVSVTSLDRVVIVGRNNIVPSLE